VRARPHLFTEQGPIGFKSGPELDTRDCGLLTGHCAAINSSAIQVGRAYTCKSAACCSRVRACVGVIDSSTVSRPWSAALSAYKFTSRPFVFQTSTNFAKWSCRPTTHVDRPRGTNRRRWSDSLSFEWRQHVITQRTWSTGHYTTKHRQVCC